MLLQKKLEVLSILSDNLHNPRPQPMETSDIARLLNVRETELHPVLKMMHGVGYIETDPDLSHSLITRAGLCYLSERRNGDNRCGR